jgi:hypothetical protein
MIYEEDIDEDTLEELEDLLVDHDIEIRTDYSGRGMFGKRCLAFVGSPGEPPSIVAWMLGKSGWDWDSIPKNQDSMGSGWVIY